MDEHLAAVLFGHKLKLKNNDIESDARHAVKKRLKKREGEGKVKQEAGKMAPRTGRRKQWGALRHNYLAPGERQKSVCPSPVIDPRTIVVPVIEI